MNFQRVLQYKSNVQCSLIFRGIDNEFHSHPCRRGPLCTGCATVRDHPCLVTPCAWRTQKRYFGACPWRWLLCSIRISRRRLSSLALPWPPLLFVVFPPALRECVSGCALCVCTHVFVRACMHACTKHPSASVCVHGQASVHSSPCQIKFASSPPLLAAGLPKTDANF